MNTATDREPTMTEWAASNALRSLDYAQSQLNHARKYLEAGKLELAVDAMERMAAALDDANVNASQGL